MSEPEAVSWGSRPPPRNLATAPRAVKGRLQFSQTVLLSVSSVSAFIAVCLFVSILPESPEQQLLAAVALGILVLGAFLAARAFDEMTTRCLRDAVAARFVVDSVEKVRSVGQEWAWQGYLVGLTGRDPPHLKLTVRADETTELVPGSTEVLALSADRGEYLVLGLSDREVATGRPAGPNDRRFLASGW